MKKHIYLLIFFLFGLMLFASQTTYGQFERIEINYSVEEIIVDGKTYYNLEVEAKYPSDKIIYTLYKGALLPENMVKKSSPTKKSTYLFKKLPAGRYSIIVFESKNKGGFESLEIGN